MEFTRVPGGGDHAIAAAFLVEPEERPRPLGVVVGDAKRGFTDGKWPDSAVSGAPVADRSGKRPFVRLSVEPSSARRRRSHSQRL